MVASHHRTGHSLLSARSKPVPAHLADVHGLQTINPHLARTRLAASQVPTPKSRNHCASSSANPPPPLPFLQIHGEHARIRVVTWDLLKKRPFPVQPGTMIIPPQSTILPGSKPALKLTLLPLQVRARDTHLVSRSTLLSALDPARDCNLHTPDRRAAPRAPEIHSTHKQNVKVMVMVLLRHLDRRLRRMITRLDPELGLWMPRLHGTVKLNAIVRLVGHLDRGRVSVVRLHYTIFVQLSQEICPFLRARSLLLQKRVTRQIHGESFVLRAARWLSGLLRADSARPRWKGKLDAREGSFPANFVEVV